MTESRGRLVWLWRLLKWFGFACFAVPVVGIVVLDLLGFLGVWPPSAPAPRATDAVRTALHAGSPMLCRDLTGACRPILWTEYLLIQTPVLVMGGGFALLVTAALLNQLWRGTQERRALWRRRLARLAGVLCGVAFLATFTWYALLGLGVATADRTGTWDNHGVRSSFAGWQRPLLYNLAAACVLLFMTCLVSYRSYSHAARRTIA